MCIVWYCVCVCVCVGVYVCTCVYVHCGDHFMYIVFIVCV